MILILVEHPSRELEIAVALKGNLLKMGINAEIVSINFNYKWIFNLTKYKLILFPSLQWNIINSLKPIFGGIILSLNYEQMLSEANKILKPIRGNSIKLELLHISWSEEYKTHLINNGVDSKNIYVINKPSLELYKNLGINSNIMKLKNRYKKTIFIPMTDLQAFKSDKYLSREFKDIKSYNLAINRRDYVKRTLDIIIDWVNDAAIFYPDFLFIIRPHPSISPKHYEQLFKELNISKANNLLVISDYNAFEWIKQSDIIFSNYSSLLIDAQEFGKLSLILEPEIFPEFLSYEWMKNFNKINNKEMFINFISTNTESINNLENNKKYNGISDLSNLIKVIYFKIQEKRTKTNFRQNIAIFYNIIFFLLKSFFKNLLFKLNKSFLKPGLVIDHFKDIK